MKTKKSKKRIKFKNPTVGQVTQFQKELKEPSLRITKDHANGKFDAEVFIGGCWYEIMNVSIDLVDFGKTEIWQSTGENMVRRAGTDPFVKLSMDFIGPAVRHQ